jgi:hypothetical protein
MVRLRFTPARNQRARLTWMALPGCVAAVVSQESGIGPFRNFVPLRWRGSLDTGRAGTLFSDGGKRS